MDEKTFHTLEYDKILERLASYAAFSASADLARNLRPTTKLDEAQRRQARTSEAGNLLSMNTDISVGAVYDIRPLADLAAHSGVLSQAELLEVKNTLCAARDLERSLTSAAKNNPVYTHREVAVDTLQNRDNPYPQISVIAESLAPPPGIIDTISRAISDTGEILDQASPLLSTIRTDLKHAHARLLGRLEHLINDPKITPILQESIITQRNGRYVIPLRADFKGRIRAMIHDQSSSGATLFVEPLAVVELNNRWHELQLAERDEERRILAELSNEVGKHNTSIEALVIALAELDLALMCAKYAQDLRASEPLLVDQVPVTENHPGSTILLYQARHPLLDQTHAVPVDIDLDERTFALVITGPNTGGKTVTLKTMGLLVLMAQTGLHIPARSGSTLSVFKDVYADIGDEQSIEQSLSTFSGHIRNIIRILANVDHRTLVLLDELGAGTDPQEGAALARTILADLVERRIPCAVATHYPELKTFAHATPGVVNASMEFDPQSLRPTYHLMIGLPGRSNALLIAERLGLPQTIIQAARSTINPADLRADDLLDDIHRQRDWARQAWYKADLARQEAEQMRSDLVKRLEKIEDERIELLEKARQQADSELAALQIEMTELRRTLTRARQPLDELKPVQEQIEALQEEVDAAKPVRKQLKEVVKRPLKVGARVRLRSLNLEGVLVSLNAEEAEVQLGALRVRAKVEDLQRPGKDTSAAVSETQARTPSSRTTPSPFHPLPGVELDLRGKRSDEALENLESYLEDAYLAGLPYVRVIHGKGTGALRQAVRQAIRQSPHVKSWVAGQDNEGGEGVTVAHLLTE